MSDPVKTVTLTPLIVIVPESLLSRLAPYTKNVQHLLDTDPQWREKIVQTDWDAQMLAAGTVLEVGLDKLESRKNEKNEKNEKDKETS